VFFAEKKSESEDIQEDLTVFEKISSVVNHIKSRSLRIRYAWRDEGKTEWTFVSFEHPMAHEERCWREWPTQWYRCVIKRTQS